MPKNANGAYDYETLITVKLDKLGCLNLKDTSNGSTMFVQFEIDETLKSIRFIDGSREELEHGWPCIAGIDNNIWAAYHEEN